MKDKSKTAQLAKKGKEQLVKKAEYMRKACKEKKVSNVTERMSRARKKTDSSREESKKQSSPVSREKRGAVG